MNKTHQYLKYRYRSSIYILIQQGAPLASLIDYTFISHRLCLVSETLELWWYLFWLFLILHELKFSAVFIGSKFEAAFAQQSILSFPDFWHQVSLITNQTQAICRWLFHKRHKNSAEIRKSYKFTFMACQQLLIFICLTGIFHNNYSR